MSETELITEKCPAQHVTAQGAIHPCLLPKGHGGTHVCACAHTPWGGN